MNNKVKNKDRELTYFNHNSYGNPHTQYVSNNQNFALRPYEMINNSYYNVLTVLLDDKVLNKDINDQFQICFDVYDNYTDGIDNDDKWELFLKAGNGNPEFYRENGSVMVKLKGKERRALVILDRETVQKEVRIDTNDSHSIKSEPLKKIRLNLYVKLEHDTRLVMKFMNSNIEEKYITIHDRNYAIPEEYIKNKLTKEEIKFYTNKLKWVEQAISDEDKAFQAIPITDPDYDKKNDWHDNNKESYTAQQIYCQDKLELAKDTNNLVNTKIFSRTDNGVIKYNSPSANDGERYIKLFDLDNRFNADYHGVFELYTSYGVEYKKKYANKYIKFMISCSNTSENDFEVGFNILDSKNIDKDTLFVTKTSEGLLSVWIKDLYPSKVKLVPILNDDPKYRVFKINDIDNEFIKFLPSDHENKIFNGESFYDLK